MIATIASAAKWIAGKMTGGTPGPTPVPPQPTLTISDAAIDLIVAEEVGSKALYIARYTHFSYPGVASGPTIAIGYDCGYTTPGQAAHDWEGIVDQPTIAHIVAACGLRGAEAAEFVRTNGRSVTVTWDQAMAQFKTRILPQWIAKVTRALPNTDKLSPDSLGAIVSLAYNRGCAFDNPGPRDAEMREIKTLMSAQNFAQIPNEFLSMRRLWPVNGDLWRRRMHEAALFQKGLTVKQT